MTAPFENSAGVIPFRVAEDGTLHYLVLHSATVRNPRARWEFPKGGIEEGESARQAAAREFEEETGLRGWKFREGFEQSLSYTYVRRGRRVLKTVTYYVVEVESLEGLCRSAEHVEDASGRWHVWGPIDEVRSLLYHPKIRNLFARADAWILGLPDPPQEGEPPGT